MKTKQIKNPAIRMIIIVLLCVLVFKTDDFGKERNETITHEDLIEKLNLPEVTKLTESKDVTKVLQFDRKSYEEVSKFNIKNEKQEDPPFATKLDEIEEVVGYTTSRLNLRERPTTESKVISTIGWNKKIKYKPINSEWAYVEYKKNNGYVSRKYISDNEIDYEVFDVPFYEHQKSYMDYRKIENVSSKAYKLQAVDAYTGKYGIRQVDGRFLCALGTYYVEDDDIGRYVDLVLRNGEVIPCIIGDNKDNSDTDSTNRYTCHDNSITEFVVDTPAMRREVRKQGNLNYATSKWNSSIVKIVVYNYKHAF